MYVYHSRKKIDIHNIKVTRIFNYSEIKKHM